MAAKLNEPGGAPLERLPVLPLRDVVFFPYVVMPLVVGRPGSIAAIEAAAAGDGRLLLVSQRDNEVQEPSATHMYRVGVVARITQLTPLGNGSTRILLEGLQRARVTRYVSQSAHLSAIVAPTDASTSADDPEVLALARSVLASFEEYVG